MNTAAESPFAVPAYRRLFTAHSTALVGSGVSTIALALLAIEIAPERASIVLGTALAIKMIAYVLVAPFASQMVTYVSPRTGLIVLDVVRAAVVVSMPWIAAEWQIYAAIAVISAASALFTPTFQALIPSVVTNETAYLRALSWSQVAGSVEQIASPVLAALFLTVVTFSDLFYLNAATFLFSASLIALTVISRPPQPVAAANPWWGIGAYLKTPRLRAVAIAYIGIAGASAMVIVNTAVYVQRHLGASESVMSLTLAAGGLGTALGAFLVPRVALSPRTLLLAGNLIMAASIMVGVFEVGWRGLAAMWFFVGLGLGLAQTPVGAIVRRSCHERHRAAFFAANFTLSHACWLGAYLLAGYLGATHDWPTTFLLMSVLPLLAGLIFMVTYPHPDELELEHSHGDLIHRHAYFIDESHTSWPRPNQ